MNITESQIIDAAKSWLKENQGDIRVHSPVVSWITAVRWYEQNFCKPDVSGCKELLLQMIEREQKYIDKCRSEGKGHEHSKGIIKGLEIAINVEENYHRLIAI